MPIDATLSALLACPQCKGGLSLQGTPEDGNEALHCTACALAFPVDDGVPVMVLDSARALQGEGLV